MDITGNQIEQCTIETEEDLDILKKNLRIYFPSLMAKIVEILLYRQEEQLACLLTAYYELNLQSANLKTAVKEKQFKWLSFVWVFGKNWYGYRNRPKQREKVIIKQLLEIIANTYDLNVPEEQ